MAERKIMNRNMRYAVLFCIQCMVLSLCPDAQAQYWHYQSDEDADEIIRDAVIDQNGDLIITGLHTFGGAGNNSFYVKVDQDGEQVFYNHFTTNNDMGPNDLSLHRNGGTILLNKGREWTYYETWTKYIILGIDENGEEEWRNELDVRPEIPSSGGAFHVCSMILPSICSIRIKEKWAHKTYWGHCIGNFISWINLEIKSDRILFFMAIVGLDFMILR